MRATVVSLFALSLALVAPACTTPMVAASCTETECSAACIEDGNIGGTCSASGMCTCEPPPVQPMGDTVVGITSGGVVDRESGSYRLRMAVGPAEAATGTSEGTTSTVRLGLEGQTDP